MTFALPEETIDTASTLRSLEHQAPKNIRPVMLQAATELETLYSHIEDWQSALEKVSALRIGQMDSQSKVDDVWKEIRLVMANISRAMKELM